MHPNQEPQDRPALRKLMPNVKPPRGDTLAQFSGADRALLERRLEEQAECVFNPLFLDPDVERILIDHEPSAGSGSLSPTSCDDSGANFIMSDDEQALPIDAERHIFLRFNYCRYRVFDVLESRRGKRLSIDEARDLLRWERLVMATRNEIVRQNIPLVLAMVKRSKISGVDYADLISEGNLALMRSVDKFDCARGFKFSTYSCRAILKSFARVATRTARYRGHFPTEFDPTLEKSDELDRQRASVETDCIDELRSILGDEGSRLNGVEQTVIKARFAIAVEDEQSPDSAKTLEQVGDMIGVTKERVRQIQNKALLKLRTMLEGGVLAVKS